MVLMLWYSCNGNNVVALTQGTIAVELVHWHYAAVLTNWYQFIGTKAIVLTN